jgi:predicted ATP-grasp superfamily ATP-dependent carboligase
MLETKDLQGLLNLISTNPTRAEEFQEFLAKTQQYEAAAKLRDHQYQTYGEEAVREMRSKIRRGIVTEKADKISINLDKQSYLVAYGEKDDNYVLRFYKSNVKMLPEQSVLTDGLSDDYVISIEFNSFRQISFLYNTISKFKDKIIESTIAELAQNNVSAEELKGMIVNHQKQIIDFVQEVRKAQEQTESAKGKESQ